MCTAIFINLVGCTRKNSNEIVHDVIQSISVKVWGYLILLGFSNDHFMILYHIKYSKTAIDSHCSDWYCDLIDK